MPKVIIIDDEQEICNSVEMILDYEGYDVDYTTSATDGLEKLKSAQFDVALLDIQMPDMSGFEVLSKAKEVRKDIAVIIISAHSNIENAIKATKLGAFDFIEKPIDRDKLLISIRNAVEHSTLKRENEDFKKKLGDENEILGNSKAIDQIHAIIDKVSKTDVRVLITGENGTGKELVARAIHHKSERSKKPLVEVNCAAIPNELIESELFGHEKGSYTGAHQQRIGKFELAHKGTLFLDEIGDMSLQAQAKVLRAIEDGTIQRVGGSKNIEVDVRIISATNKNLPEMIEENEFREDLYHRLNVIPVHVPPLRDRLEDIPILVEHFAAGIAQKHNQTAPKFSDDALKMLQQLKWTGNVRELRNIIERIIILVTEPIISRKDIEFLVPIEKVSIDQLITESNSFQEFKEKAERAFIVKQLDANGWNISKTAEILEIQRSHLYNKLKKYGIEKGES